MSKGSMVPGDTPRVVALPLLIMIALCTLAWFGLGPLDRTSDLVIASAEGPWTIKTKPLRLKVFSVNRMSDGTVVVDAAIDARDEVRRNLGVEATDETGTQFTAMDDPLAGWQPTRGDSFRREIRFQRAPGPSGYEKFTMVLDYGIDQFKSVNIPLPRAIQRGGADDDLQPFAASRDASACPVTGLSGGGGALSRRSNITFANTAPTTPPTIWATL